MNYLNSYVKIKFREFVEMILLLCFGAILLIPILYLTFVKREKRLINKFLGQFWSNSFNFKGKTKRNVFWMTQGSLLLFLFWVFALSLIFFMFSKGTYKCENLYWCGTGEYTYILPQEDWRPFIYVPTNVFILINIIPSISLQIRRLRDAEKNPYWILISLLPYIGGIILFIFYLIPGKEQKQQVIDERLKELDNLLSKGKIDEEEFKYLRKQILIKMFR